jgi:N-hydroxyarylamine O-acetyltransferase
MTVDLPAYAARTGYTGLWNQTHNTLKNLHLAHANQSPFENLDVLLRRPIRLDLESLWAKLITARRGGYCFEQNALFAAVLEAAGYPVTRLAARVRMGAAAVRPRSHMMLAVQAEGETLLADVGFGGAGLLIPIPLNPGASVEHQGWTHRLIAEGAVQVLQAQTPAGWLDLYSFTQEPQYPVDYEVSNHYASTHPSSPFTKMILVQRPTPECRLLLQNRRLIEQRPSASSELVLPNYEAILEALATRFNLHFPPGTTFPYEET